MLSRYLYLNGYEEHRLVWEVFNDACLLPWGVVHHKNGIKDDNRPENIEAMTRSQHSSLHSSQRWKNGYMECNKYRPTFLRIIGLCIQRGFSIEQAMIFAKDQLRDIVNRNTLYCWCVSVRKSTDRR